MFRRQPGKDQARFYECALGSAREARGWYYHAQHVLTDLVATDRMRLLTRMARLLLAIIPAQRGYKLKEAEAPYAADSPALLNDPPIP